MARPGACSKIKLDFNQHVVVFFFWQNKLPEKNNLHIDCVSDKAECVMCESDVVYYSQETNIQLLWHICLCGYESIVAKTLAATKFDTLPT